MDTVYEPVGGTVDTDCVRPPYVRTEEVLCSIHSCYGNFFRNKTEPIKFEPKTLMATCLLLFCNQYLTGLGIYLPQI